MIQQCDVFSVSERLNLTPTERRLWLDPLLDFLHKNPTLVGDLLLGKPGEPWCKQEVRELEKLILGKVGDRNAKRGYLSILHEAAHLWSVTTGENVKLPRFLGPLPNRENPFRLDYASEVADYTTWKDKLGIWIKELFPEAGKKCEDRALLLVSFLVSSILYGGDYGVPFLVAIARALSRKSQVRFAIGGRIHVELSLTVKGIVDAERQVWLPDAESAVLWDKLESSDVSELLAPVVKNGAPLPPNDGEIFRRIGRLVRQTLEHDSKLIGIQNLRRCTLEVALSQIKPVVVGYGNCQFPSDSLSRADIRRLFPNSALLESVTSGGPEPGTKLMPIGQPADQTAASDPDWCDALLDSARSKPPRDSLTRMANDASTASPLRLVARFGVSLLSSSSASGKPMSHARVVETLALIARGLGTFLERQDLAALPPVERRRVYLEGVNGLPVGSRRDAVAAIRAFDLYLVARNSTTCPVARNGFPWLPQTSSVDANLVTHREYAAILRKIDTDWPAEDGEARRRIARLIVIISFRCGLRRSEMRRLRMADLLMRASANPLMRHLVELHVRRRKGDPLKTKNAVRRICSGALLTMAELDELRAWFDSRIQQGAKMEEHLFAIPEQKLSRMPKSFFEQLNTFLRGATKYADCGRGIHLHHMRHAAHSWLFVSLIWSDMLSDLAHPPNLFLDLVETNEWLAEGKLIRHLLHRYSVPTRKDPFLLAYHAGHSSFDVTAGSYIHLFPWVLAAFLERSKLMVPSTEEIRRASGLPDTTFRRWLLDCGINSIPLQLFKKTCTSMQPPISVELNAKTRTESSENSDDWLNPAWNSLLRWNKRESDPQAMPGLDAMITRAKHLRGLPKEDKHFRHLMQSWVKDKRKPKHKRRLACPLRPPHERNMVGGELISIIGNVHAKDPELLQDALGLFKEQLERGAFVRFDSIEKLADADRYIEFLRNLGLGKRQIELISGDPDTNSEYRRNWSNSLDEPNMSIKPCGESRNYGAKSSLSIRPDFGETGMVLGTGPAGFRFAMAMAFIVFGELSDGPSLLAVETA